MSSVAKRTNGTIRGVALDLDGLMVNTEAVFNRAGRELARRRGKEMTNAVFQQMMGRRPDEAFTVMIDALQLDDTIEALRKESQEIFLGLLDEHLAPMPGLHTLLDCIEDRDLPKAVTTSSPRGYMESILKRLDLLHRFHFTLTAEDVTHGKPHPEIYQKAAQYLDIAPCEMLVLEDSEAGIRAAAAANAVAVAVPHEFSRTHDFSRADCIAERLDDPQIIRLLEPDS